MSSNFYRVESLHPISGRLVPVLKTDDHLFRDRVLAVVSAAKSVTSPPGQEIRVVHVGTGEIVFRKSAESRL